MLKSFMQPGTTNSRTDSTKPSHSGYPTKPTESPKPVETSKEDAPVVTNKSSSSDEGS